MAGFEVGYGTTADPDQLFGNGFGRVFVIAAKGWEFRVLEAYDLVDNSGMFDAAQGHGSLGISSVGRRFMIAVGPISVRPLVGLAWLRRPSLRFDQDSTFGSLFEHDVIAQHGLGLMAGGGIGIRLGYLDVSVDARAYPTKWSSIGGDRAVIRNEQVVYEPITQSPGGMPYTLTAAISIGY
jgi:hypothetical protein